jgi:hypothetical protein
MVLLQDLGTSLEQVLQGPVAGVRQ